MFDESVEDKFEERGFYGPIRLANVGQAHRVAGAIDDVLKSPALPRRNSIESRHLDSKLIFDLCTDSAVLDAVERVLGSNILLWNSVIFDKQSGAAAIPWHQDQEDVLLEPLVNVAAWIAVTDCHQENGCLRFVPGSHKERIPHFKNRPNQFAVIAEPGPWRKEPKETMELKAGEFVIFHTSVLHGSPANLSLDRRTGIVARFTVPGVKVAHQGIYAGHGVVCVRGADNSSINQVVKPPTSDPRK